MDIVEIMRVLSISYEVAPLFKVGGLGDVAGSLPKALSGLGVSMSILMPYYGTMKIGRPKQVVSFSIPFEGKDEEVEIFETTFPHTTILVYVVRNKRYLDGLEKDPLAHQIQFAFFSKAASEFIAYTCSKKTLQFDLLHLHDWHTALIPLILENKYFPARMDLPKTLLTIHNFGYQAITPITVLEKLGISRNTDPIVRWDARDRTLEYLKEGIAHVDFITTVSPTYRNEIMDVKESGKLAEVMKSREGRVVGILNGIDYSVWSPQTDRHLVVNYGIKDAKSMVPWVTGKRINKRAVQKETGLPVIEDVPLFIFIGRIEPLQKGIDITITAFEELLPRLPLQLLILGTGNPLWEDRLHRFVKQHPQRAAFADRFDEALAHRMYAGGDFLLMPSRYEPCGLVQMIAMRYGTVPIVRRTGGLADTVEDHKTGLVFQNYSAKELTNVVKQAIRMYTTDSMKLDAIRIAGMKKDFSWEKSAKEYLRLYKKIMRL